MGTSCLGEVADRDERPGAQPESRPTPGIGAKAEPWTKGFARAGLDYTHMEAL